jgi:hypothetical protein
MSHGISSTFTQTIASIRSNLERIISSFLGIHEHAKLFLWKFRVVIRECSLNEIFIGDFMYSISRLTNDKRGDQGVFSDPLYQ